MGHTSQRVWVGVSLGVLALGACRAPVRTTLTLSVAASLTETIGEIETQYQQTHTNFGFRNNFGGSGTLAREIEQGAPVDVFLSAASVPMDELQAKGLIEPATRHDLLRNTLVLIAPSGSGLQGFAGLTSKAVRQIALGDPGSVPAGQYGKQTLSSLNLYDQLKGKIVLAKDVRQVLTYVETGNADAGLVYATDAQGDARVRIVATAPEGTHDPIIYPVAVVGAGRESGAAQQFVEYLKSPAATAVFVKHGFTMAAW
ncbi:MAG TPA: molybdate ABC transporter substrate-binding protein [Acidobacteriaceae bacterium]|nr:molybdate ABC transporter substrate-binding protein [Acidobacteriaceae bacterium]